MQRVKRSTAVAVLPAHPAGGTPGYFPQPDPGGGVPAAVPGYEWYNNIQEEIVAPILASGLTLDGSDRTQLLQAINRLIATASVTRKVRVATTAAINLAAPGATIDAATMAAGDRFLDKDNATAASRGVYVWNGAAVPATRAPDADGAGDMFGGMLVAVSEGAANGNSLWMLTTDDPITIGTTSLTFERKDAPVASTAEAQAWTENTKIITALRLKEALQGANQSIGTSGYQKLPGGLIIQWGTWAASATAGNPVVVTFPIAFPNGLRAASLAETAASTVTQSAWMDTPSNTGFNGRASGTGVTCYYTAIGN